MNNLFQPPPEVIAFFTLTKFVYLEIVLLLALVRVFVCGRWARLLSLAALLVAAVGIAAQFGPALAGLYAGPLYRASFAVTNAAAGAGILLAASIPLALAGVVPGRRWWGIDLLHGLLFAALIVLWWMTS